MNNENIRNSLLPIVAVIVLVIGNFYQGLSKEELDIIQDGILAVGTIIAGGISSYVIYKNKNKGNNKDSK